MSSNSSNTSASHDSGDEYLQRSSPDVETDAAEAPTPTRNEYASYLALVHNLEVAQSSNLASHLAKIPNSRSRTRSLSRAVTARSTEDTSIVDDAEEGDANEGEEEPRLIGGTTPLEIANNCISSKKRKRTEKLGDKVYSTRWPLLPSQLGKEDTDLSESIKTFASSYIRTHRLRFGPSPSTSSTNLISTLSSLGITYASHLEKGNENGNGEDDYIDPKIPSSLLESTREFINEILTELGASRPKVTATQRKLLRPISWQGVLSAASTTRRNEGVVRQSNTRLTQIYTPKNDPLSHRLDILSRARTDASAKPSLTELYRPLIPSTKERVLRDHQSEIERNERAAKRKEKAEARSSKRIKLV